jgi:hypothetical protein
MGIPDWMDGIMKTILGDWEVDVLPAGLVLQLNERNSPTRDLEGDFVLIWQLLCPQSSPSKDAIIAAPNTTPKIASAARKKSSLFPVGLGRVARSLS